MLLACSLRRSGEVKRLNKSLFKIFAGEVFVTKLHQQKKFFGRRIRRKTWAFQKRIEAAFFTIHSSNKLRANFVGSHVTYSWYITSFMTWKPNYESNPQTMSFWSARKRNFRNHFPIIRTKLNILSMEWKKWTDLWKVFQGCRKSSTQARKREQIEILKLEKFASQATTKYFSSENLQSGRVVGKLFLSAINVSRKQLLGFAILNFISIY